MSRLEVYGQIMTLYPLYLKKFPQGRIMDLMVARYGVSDMRLMTIEECMDLLSVIQKSVKEYVCSKTYL